MYNNNDEIMNSQCLHKDFWEILNLEVAKWQKES